jgi:hypothetical protein
MADLLRELGWDADAGRGSARRSDDDGAASTPALENAFPREDHVRTERGISVHTEIRGQVPGGWKARAREQLAGGDEEAELIDELLIDR